jgi:tRNA-Thr(GGU) m(6)t(6)A37 methyltransferase TsaA
LSRTITLSPIAFVKSPFQNNTPAAEIRSRPAQLLVEPEFEPGLMGLEAGLDILILFSFHQVAPAEIELQLHPYHDPANPRRGVFATRSQFRPNRLAATVAHIQAVEGRVITVIGLDALDGAPVLDIKPYAAYFDAELKQQQLEAHQVSTLPEAREAIDLIDAEVIRLLGNRAGFVRQVVNFKRTPDDVRAPARYVEVMRRRREMAEAAGLNPDVIEAMYKLLVEYFIQEEMEILRQRNELTGESN